MPLLSGDYADITYRADVTCTVRLSDGKIVSRSITLHGDDDSPECSLAYAISPELCSLTYSTTEAPSCHGCLVELDEDELVEEIREAERTVAADADFLELQRVVDESLAPPCCRQKMKTYGVVSPFTCSCGRTWMVRDRSWNFVNPGDVRCP
jgi:hypothetical protein